MFQPRLSEMFIELCVVTILNHNDHFNLNCKIFGIYLNSSNRFKLTTIAVHLRQSSAFSLGLIGKTVAASVPFIL